MHYQYFKLREQKWCRNDCKSCTNLTMIMKDEFRYERLMEDDHRNKGIWSAKEWSIYMEICWPKVC